MSFATPASLDLAQRLLALEAGEAGTSEAKAALVCEKLRAVLTTFAGAAGFRALLTRALTLAKLQAPSLAAVQVLEDGTLTGLDKLRPGTNSGQGAGGQILVAHLLELLAVFIGEPLMLRLIRDAWPDAPASALRSRAEDTETA